MIDRGHALSVTKQAEAAGIARSTVYYLPRPVSGSRSRTHAPDRQAASGVPLRGGADVAPSFGCQWEQGRTASCEDADAADGDRGAVPASAHDEAGAGAQDLPVSAARHGGRAAEPGLGDGHHVHPDGEGLCLSRRGARLVLAARAVVAGVDHDGGLVLRRGAGGRSGRAWKPEIFNTDQGSQFTGAAFTGVLIKNEIAISMDGKGAWRDNVFVERLWRTVKYEEVYLHAYDSVPECQKFCVRNFCDGVGAFCVFLSQRAEAGKRSPN